MPLNDICSHCQQDGFNCRCDTFHPSHRKLFTMNVREVEELDNFLFAQGYISHEFHPGIHALSKRIREFMKGK